MTHGKTYHPVKVGHGFDVSPHRPSWRQEIAEPLFHLKLAMKQLAASQTFRCILATVLAIGNFLNGCKVRDPDLQECFTSTFLPN